MPTKITSKEVRQKIKDVEELMELENRQSNLNRARSITVGTAYSGGVLEIALRGNGDRHLWMILQPTEVIELINQLSAAIGCHIHIQPREDFASWRKWNDGTEEKTFIPTPVSTYPPQSISTKKHQSVGFNFGEDAKEKENVMATKKAVNKRATK